MLDANPLYSIFPQYSRTELDQIYSENSYDADAASEHIAKGVLDWNKNLAQKQKKRPVKPQKRYNNKPKREYRERTPIEHPVDPKPAKLPTKLQKQDSAIDQMPSMSFILQNGKEKMEMVEADLSVLDLSKYIVLIPKSVYEQREKEIFDRQFTSLLPEDKSSMTSVNPVVNSMPKLAPSTATQTFSSVRHQQIQSVGSPLFNNSPVHDKLRLLGINDKKSKSERPSSDLKDFVLNMGIGLNEPPTSPRTPPNTPVTAKPNKYKKPFKKRSFAQDELKNK